MWAWAFFLLHRTTNKRGFRPLRVFWEALGRLACVQVYKGSKTEKQKERPLGIGTEV